ncbi:hypothetical protein RUM44_011971 [Polyplax serrata]|uniref:Tetratricopeptide repeat protein 8 n=1 Tax=Polyplax serrata TaxID=468196 RepID=A0ABR1BC62_POLSC
MDPLYKALSYYKRKTYDKCVEKCTEILKKNPYDQVSELIMWKDARRKRQVRLPTLPDYPLSRARFLQAAWILKMRALTQSVYVDDIENEEDTMADEFLDDNIISETARAGTSLRNTKPESASRPKTEIGHLVTGVVRTNLRSARTRTMEQGLKSARRNRSARPVSTQNGRHIRMGTASMLTEEEGPFIDISRLNLGKYATEISGKHLFEYLYYHENDIQNAVQLSIEAAKAFDFKDWWWMLQTGKCYYLLGCYRNAEQFFRSALKQHVNIETFLRLIKIYRKLDQPLTALDVCKKASGAFPDEIFFTIEAARLHEALNDIFASIVCYRNVALRDASNVEAIACIGLHHFYTDQPEIALRFYKRLLEMGFVNAQIMNNIGLCSFFAQQFDVSLSCFKRALALAEGEESANIWYNLSHIAIGVGDLNLARNCLRLALSIDGNHASALNNLGVLEVKRNNLAHAKSFFASAIRQAPLLFEPNFNHAKLTFQCGDLQTSYRSAQKALNLSPTHVHAIHLVDTLKRYFMQV